MFLQKWDAPGSRFVPLKASFVVFQQLFAELITELREEDGDFTNHINSNHLNSLSPPRKIKPRFDNKNSKEK